jgi:hypothetical protein
MNTLRLSVLLCLALSWTAVAVADELKLSNGDRLTGTVVSLTGGSLTFKTAHGELKIPWPNVTSLTMEGAATYSCDLVRSFPIRVACGCFGRRDLGFA